jgi:hypothetical protein
MLEERRDEDATLHKNPEEEEPFSIPPSRWQASDITRADTSGLSFLHLTDFQSTIACTGSAPKGGQE